MTTPIKPPRTRVVNIKYAHADVSITRPGMWGNPFIIGRDGTREDVIAKHEQHVRNSPRLMKLLPQLRGRVLGCVCKNPPGSTRPEVPCHGDNYVKILLEMFPEDADNAPCAD